MKKDKDTESLTKSTRELEKGKNNIRKDFLEMYECEKENRNAIKTNSSSSSSKMFVGNGM